MRSAVSSGASSRSQERLSCGVYSAMSSDCSGALRLRKSSSASARLRDSNVSMRSLSEREAQISCNESVCSFISVFESLIWFLSSANLDIFVTMFFIVATVSEEFL